MATAMLVLREFDCRKMAQFKGKGMHYKITEVKETLTVLGNCISLLATSEKTTASACFVFPYLDCPMSTQKVFSWKGPKKFFKVECICIVSIQLITITQDCGILCEHNSRKAFK